MRSETFSCGHSGTEGHSRLCSHLIGMEDVVYARVLRGKGLEADLCCSACAKKINDGESIEWKIVCEACVELLDENEWDLIEWIGQPEIKEQPAAFDFTLNISTLPDEVVLTRRSGSTGCTPVYGMVG